MIVLTAPTGQIGANVARELVANDHVVRVVVRDPGRLSPAIRDRVDVVEGSHGDAATIGRALDGAVALFWVAPAAVSNGSPPGSSASASAGWPFEASRLWFASG